MKNTKPLTTHLFIHGQKTRDLNEIVSAQFNFPKLLKKKSRRAEENNRPLPHTLRLCFGATSSQNKNGTIMEFLLNFVQVSNVFNKAVHIFRIRGHTFMLPDRVFGSITSLFY